MKRRYSQVEKDALAVVWGWAKLHLYPFGGSFHLVTDNGAVEFISRNPKNEPPPSIKRWLLRLSWYRCDIVHKPGPQNIANYLSKQPRKKT